MQLRFHAPRQLYADTRDLNVGLLYEAKDGLLPQGAEVSDLENAYAGMIRPFLFFDRSNLANQAMALLAQVERKEEASLQLAIARLNLDSGNLQHAEESLKEADPLVKPGSSLAGEKEELWGVLYETLGDTNQAKPRRKHAKYLDTRSGRIRLAMIAANSAASIEAFVNANVKRLRRKKA